MGSVKEYFSNLGSGIASLVKGMQVTGKEFVTPKITEEYPDNRDNLPVADASGQSLHSSMTTRATTNVSPAAPASVSAQTTPSPSTSRPSKHGTVKRKRNSTNITTISEAAPSASFA